MMLTSMDFSTAQVRAVGADAGAAAGVFGRTSRAQRAQLLRAIADELEADREEIERLAVSETSLSPARLAGEMNRTINQALLFAAVLDDGGYLDATIDHATNSTPDIRRTRVPVGAVAVFGASNFPLAFSVPGGDTVSALAAGCPVVIKAHPGHPLTSERSFAALSRAVARTNLPPATVGLVAGFAAGRDLVLDPNIRAVGFTGSTGAGRALFDLAAARPEPIPFFGELGSLNPVVVTPAAALARGPQIAHQLAASISGSAGQLCTKPNLVFVPESAGDELVGNSPPRSPRCPRRRYSTTPCNIVSATVSPSGQPSPGPWCSRMAGPVSGVLNSSAWISTNSRAPSSRRRSGLRLSLCATGTCLLFRPRLSSWAAS